MSFDPVLPWPILAGLVGGLAFLVVLRGRTERRQTVVAAALVLVLGCLLLRPGIGTAVARVEDPPDHQVLVVLDRTPSMAALDGVRGEPRLDSARRDLDALTDRLPDARFGLLVWGEKARLAVPFTSDLDAVDEAVRLTATESPVGSTGSRIDRPLALVTRVLEDAREQFPERKQVVLFISDGENTEAGRQRSYAPLAGMLDGGVVLGYGSPAGAVMPVAPGSAQLVPDVDRGDVAISRRDDDNLRRVASELEVDYVSAAGAPSLSKAARSLKPRLPPPEGTSSPTRNLTWLVALLLLGLATLALRESWRSWHEARRLR